MKVVINDIPVNYEEYGQGTPLMLIHGYSANACGMAKWLESSITWPVNIRRIYVDLPGHGLTPTQDKIYNSDDILHLVSEIPSYLFPGENYIVAGHSYGAYIVRGLIKLQAEKISGACFLAPMVVPDSPQRKILPFEFFEEEKGISNEFSEQLGDLLDFIAVRSRRVLKSFVDDGEVSSLCPGEKAFQKALRSDISRYAFSFDVDHVIEPFKKPSLMITARQDNIVGYEDALAILPNFQRLTFTLLDKTSHLLEGQEPLLSSLINEWIERCNIT